VETTAIRSAVLGVISTIAPGFDVLSIRADRPLRQQIELDSMDWLNLVAGVSERFAVEIPEREAAQLQTLDALAAKLAARAPAAGKAPMPLPCTQHRIDGVDVRLRPMQAADLPLEADFVRHLLAQSRYDRSLLTPSERRRRS